MDVSAFMIGTGLTAALAGFAGFTFGRYRERIAGPGAMINEAIKASRRGYVPEGIAPGELETVEKYIHECEYALPSDICHGCRYAGRHVLPL